MSFPNSAPRAIVFDLDDTIADTCGSILGAAERAALLGMIDAGLRVEFEEAWALLREIRDGDPGRKFLHVLAERFGGEDAEAIHQAGRRIFFASRPEEIRPVAGAHEVLADLRARGILLFLVTFGVPEAQARKIEVLGIREYFEEVHVVPLDDGPGKTEVLRGILARTGHAPGDVWVVGDRTPGEIRSGNLLGMRTVRIRQGEFAALEPTGPEEEPDVTLTSLSSLPTLLA